VYAPSLPIFFCWEVVLQSFYPWLVWNHNPLDLSFLCSWDDKEVPQHSAISWDRISWTFCWGWPQTTILISAS
jgi:hypothetical protein